MNALQTRSVSTIFLIIICNFKVKVNTLMQILLRGITMQRLTFKKEDGTFGVIGMNETNAEQKIYACILKLMHYEDSGKSPEEISRILETKQGGTCDI